MELIASIILLIIIYCLYKAPERKFNNRVSPPGMKTDWGKMNHDTAMGMSKRDVMNKFNNGGYDIPDKK